MTVKITIIGLGQVGASLGLALAAHKDRVTTIGHDKDISIENSAKKKGVVDKTDHNLPNSIREADLVVLALPIHQVRETLKYISQDLKQNAVIVDTSPIKAEVAKWMQEILPEEVHYVGLVPTVGADYLHEVDAGLTSARADLFSKSIFLLSVPLGTPGAAIDLVSGVVGLTGASVLLTDFVESDGLTTTAHLLPQLISASLLNATLDMPGWTEARKVAGRAYFSGASALAGLDDAQALGLLTLQNRENILQKMDAIITALTDLRADIEAGNEKALEDKLKKAQDGHQNWLRERHEGEWLKTKQEQVEKVSMTERLLGSMFSRNKLDKKGQ